MERQPGGLFQAGPEAVALLTDAGIDATAAARQVDGKFMGAFVRARKPGTQQHM